MALANIRIIGGGHVLRLPPRPVALDDTGGGDVADRELLHSLPSMIAKAVSISVSFDALRTRMSCPIACAAASISWTWKGVFTLAGLTTNAISLVFGTSSRSR